TTVEAEHGAGGEDVFRPSGGGGDQETTPPRPALLSWSGPGTTSPPPPRDRYSLRLVSGRRLYDDGTLVHHSPSLAPLADGAQLRVHPGDLQPLGVGSGARVGITSSRGRMVLEAVTDPGVPQGTVFLAFNQPGSAASELIDVGQPVTEVRLETISQGSEARSGG
ncbi:MAG: hypothetical protein M3N25_01810, partial [Actinomycetota bacterium]|nr:hypothetical protein [Actinomycetota bacterium]